MTGRELLQLTINSLNTVEVKGEENLEALLGAIQSLKALRDMDSKKKEDEDDVND